MVQKTLGYLLQTTPRTEKKQMLVFNCTKAATEFFSVTRQGKKISLIEPAPHKTIVDSLTTSPFPDDTCDNNAFQWQWVVHCISIKRKKYLLVMDYHSRYCIMFPAGKKGDDIAFLNRFEMDLKANFRYWVDNISTSPAIDQIKATEYIAQYDAAVSGCVFHQRSDRSVQAHMKEVVWQLQGICEEHGPITERLDCLMFNAIAAQMLRKRPNEKDYFQANEALYAYWLATFSPDIEEQ